VRIRQIYETIDRQPFQWVVVLVAGIGFFLDGYTVMLSQWGTGQGGPMANLHLAIR
jgi:hypothetical protein